jgi:hypothetical protein
MLTSINMATKTWSQRRISGSFSQTGPRSDSRRCPITLNKSSQHHRRSVLERGELFSSLAILPQCGFSWQHSTCPPPIPSIYRHDTAEDPRQSSVAMGLGPSSPGSIRSFHSRASTDPGPQQWAWSSSPVKSISTCLSSLSVCKRIAFFDCGASPAPCGLGLVHGTCSGSPTGTHRLGLGLGLSLTRSPASASMLSIPFSPAQFMLPMSPSADSTGARFEEPRSISHHLSLSSLSRSRPASPVKSVKSYQSPEGMQNILNYS